MDITGRNRERSTVFIAVVTLVIIGISLLASTSQTLRHQNEAEEQHLFLTSRAVLLAVESSLRRLPLRDSRQIQQMAEFFQTLEREGDVLFAGVIDPQGGRLLTSSMQASDTVTLPKDMVRELFEADQWNGRLSIAGQRAYVYGKKFDPPRRPLDILPELAPPVFLVVGIDMEKHLAAYKGFRQNAMLQGVYMLAAALFTWGLAVSFLSRREQARRAVTLERFQAKLLDNLPDGLVTLDSALMIRSVNPAALAILHRSSEDLLDHGAAELPAAVAACVQEQAHNPAQRGWQRISGEGAHLEVLTLPFSGETEEDAFLVILRDRTALRRLEQSLAEAEKLAAVGTLAAGVAHEVRNPLSSLRGFAQYFVKKLAGRQPEEEYAKTMVREADRLNRVITDLLFLARPKSLAPETVSLPAVVEDMLQLLRLDLEQKRVAVHADLRAGAVYADAEALKQALLNLLINSLDALPEGGQDIVIASQETAEGVRIEVRDRGRGMSAEQLRQAFEPFFTGKEHGTGLGLALVRRTLHDHGGRAWAASEPGRGCTVFLLFPPAPAPEAAAHCPPAHVTPLPDPAQGVPKHENAADH